MSTKVILRVLALRHRLRRRDHWTRRQLEEYQGRALGLLRERACARSPFYGKLHRGLADSPLDELPVLTKETVMEHLDELVTYPTVRLADVEAHLATPSGGDELFDGQPASRDASPYGPPPAVAGERMRNVPRRR